MSTSSETTAANPAIEALSESKKLHWFIPDGMRADPEVFQVFRWAEEGKLPNIAKMMKQGTWGYSIPTFPSHTPTNFATLFTGTWPSFHGVADGPMRTEGAPLARPSVGGFSSAARKLPAIWSLLEGPERKVALVSVPGSTPPELKYGGLTVRGRWGGWGADLPSVIFERESAQQRKLLGREARLFMLASELTRFVAPGKPGTWSEHTGDALFEISMEAHGLEILGLGLDTDSDGGVDHMAFSSDRKEIFATLAVGEWSDWRPATLSWNEHEINSHVRLNVIRLKADGHFRVRLLVDSLNRFVTDPSDAAEPLRKAAGPMVDFADNFPAQLVHYPEDKETFLAEARQSLEWHGRAVGAVYEQHAPDVFVHDIYTPNQMLTSRWWMGFLDPASSRYADVSDAEREALWAEVHELYQGLDAIIGQAMAHIDENTVLVLSSDHGAVPVNRQVRLNNLFAERGWLEVKEDPGTGAPIVDWESSRVVFLNMYSVYVHPDGLGGDWSRASGPAYEALRDEVIEALQTVKDEDGTAPVASVVKWEEAAETRRVPESRIGDLVVANHPGFGWSEETAADGAVFRTPKVTGYKQAIEPGTTKGIWTPFIIMGPGVKAGHRLEEPIRHIDQLPTILTALGEVIPGHVVGQVVESSLE